MSWNSLYEEPQPPEGWDREEDDREPEDDDMDMSDNPADDFIETEYERHERETNY